MTRVPIDDDAAELPFTIDGVKFEALGIVVVEKVDGEVVTTVDETPAIASFVLRGDGEGSCLVAVEAEPTGLM